MQLKNANGSLIGLPTYRGIVKRVAEKLDIHPTYVSRVKCGVEKNKRVAEAIETERRLMDREAGR